MKKYLEWELQAMHERRKFIQEMVDAVRKQVREGMKRNDKR